MLLPQGWLTVSSTSVSHSGGFLWLSSSAFVSIILLLPPSSVTLGILCISGHPLMSAIHHHLSTMTPYPGPRELQLRALLLAPRLAPRPHSTRSHQPWGTQGTQTTSNFLLGGSMLNANLCVFNEQNSLVCADLNPLTPLPPRHGSRGPARRGGPGGHLTLLTTPTTRVHAPHHVYNSL